MYSTKLRFMPNQEVRLAIPAYITSGKEKIAITDTIKENNLIIHIAEKLPADPATGFQSSS